MTFYMRLYPKKMDNIDDLEKEKAFLARKRKELEKEDIFSVEGLLGKKKDKGGEGANRSFIDFLPISNPVISIASKVVQRLLSSKDKKPKIVNVPAPAPVAQPGKSKLKAIALEFVGGYLKWKAIELSFKGVKYLIRSRRRKHEVR